MGWQLFSRYSVGVANNDYSATNREIASVNTVKSIKSGRNLNTKSELALNKTENSLSQQNTKLSHKQITEAKSEIVELRETQAEPNQFVVPAVGKVTKPHKPKITRLNGPKSLIKQSFKFSFQSKKYPVRLKWSEVKGADLYKIEIGRDDRLEKKQFQNIKNRLDVVVYGDRNYYWRVLAYKNGDAITEYSPKFPLSVYGEQVFTEIEDRKSTDEKRHTSDSHHPIDKLNKDDGQKIFRVPANKSESKSLWSNFWAWLGGGANATGYEQELSEEASLRYDAIKYPSFSGNTGFFISDKLAVELSGGVSQGQLDERDGLFSESYLWTTYGLEALYLLNSTRKTRNSSWYLKFGGRYNQIPFLEVLTSSQTTNLLSNNILAISAGLGKRTKHSKKFRSDFSLAYQIPFSAVTDQGDYQLDSSLFINTNLNIYYDIFNQYYLGLYWQGQLFKMNYEFINNETTISGEQSLINNKLGIFLGLDF